MDRTNPYAGIPWTKINEYLLALELAHSTSDLLSKALEGIEQVIPWDVGIGLFSANLGDYLTGFGLGEAINRDYNAYYKFRVPFLPQPAFPLTDEEMSLHDAVCWNDYRDTEFATDFAKPNNMFYTLAKFIPEARIVFSLNRSRLAVPFRANECLALIILTRHVNNLYSFFERLEFARETLAGPDEVVERFPALTRREAEVLSLQNLGLTAAEIGTKLFISERTVESHAAHIHEKLSVRTTREALGRLHAAYF
jgi:DNA-binding CsgD family transcriptional regulator